MLLQVAASVFFKNLSQLYRKQTFPKIYFYLDNLKLPTESFKIQHMKNNASFSTYFPCIWIKKMLSSQMSDILKLYHMSGPNSIYFQNKCNFLATKRKYIDILKCRWWKIKDQKSDTVNRNWDYFILKKEIL